MIKESVMELDGVKIEIVKSDFSIVFRAKSPMLMFDGEKKTQYLHDLILSELTVFIGTPLKMMEQAVESWGKAYLQAYNAVSLAGQVREHFRTVDHQEIVSVPNVLPPVKTPGTSN